MFHMVVQREKYYIYFVDNLLLFPTVKEFSKSVNIW